MPPKKLKVGLDLDGVILYNPIRIARPLVVFAKYLLSHKKETRFYLPNTPVKRFIFYLFHKSSIFVAPGFEEIKKLAKEKKIEAYIISARYSFLEKDYTRWLHKTKALECFDGCFYNQKDEQPHMFKEKMIRQLKLDVYIEDNWDIVNHLNQVFAKDKVATKVFWVCNILDRNIIYKYKFNHLRQAVNYLLSHVMK